MTSTAIPPSVPGRPPAPRRRCARHEEREAVGRCTGCEGGFCRECLTEHEDRLYCGTCFASRAGAGGRGATGRRAGWKHWKKGALAAGSLLCLTAGFYGLGRVLAAIPADIHDGTVWRDPFDP